MRGGCGIEPNTIEFWPPYSSQISSDQPNAAAVGDRRWRELLEQHNHVVRGQLERYRGREVDTAGDGFLATFDGPARAIRCAIACRDELASLDLQLSGRDPHRRM